MTSSSIQSDHWSVSVTVSIRYKWEQSAGRRPFVDRVAITLAVLKTQIRVGKKQRTIKRPAVGRGT